MDSRTWITKFDGGPLRAGRTRVSMSHLALIAAAALGTLSLLGGLGCVVPLNRTQREAPPALSVESQYARPVLQHDLPEIRESGTLRVLFSNSSSSYYVLRGEEYGFEFELAREIARSMGLELEVVLPDSAGSPLVALNQGRVDLVAMPLRPQEAGGIEAAYTTTYNEVQTKLVVNSDLAASITDITDLTGMQVATRQFTEGERALHELRADGLQFRTILHRPDAPTEEILDLVADGTYPAAAVLDSELAAALRFRNSLTEALSLGPEREVYWAIRSNSPKLFAELNAQLARHHRRKEDGRIVSSEFYNVVRARYFVDERRMRRHAEHPFRFSRTGRLSPFDDLFKEVAVDVGIDWRLLAAVGFQESRFDPDVESWAGAVGVMQVRPRTAGTSADSLRIPEVNIPFGAQHLAELLDVYSFVPREDRLRFALGAYNCGQGHLDDARILSVKRGLDPNQWEGSVRESLLLLRKPEHHRQVRYGYVRGHETVAYVQDVERRYDVLKRLTRDRHASLSAREAVRNAPPTN